MALHLDKAVVHTHMGVQPLPKGAMMHFPPVSHFSLFPKNFQTSWEMFPILPFPKKFISLFIRQFPLSSAKQYICPSCFGTTFIIPPYFFKFPPDFVQFTCFFTYFACFRFPLIRPWCIYASHNARTGRPCVHKATMLLWLMASARTVSGVNLSQLYTGDEIQLGSPSFELRVTPNAPEWPEVNGFVTWGRAMFNKSSDCIVYGVNWWKCYGGRLVDKPVTWEALKLLARHDLSWISEILGIESPKTEPRQTKAVQYNTLNLS